MSRRDEQLLFRYSSALERGDFETIAEVLRDAERDPVLEQMILDLNAAYTADPSLNHKNPKEVPMIAALYQKPSRSPMRVHWQSLPLIAALAVIGLLVAMLAVQTHTNNFSNLGNTGQDGTPLAVAQNRILCETKTLTAVDLLTFPTTTNGVVLGTLPAGTAVQVLDAQALNNEQGIAMHWYFIAAQGVQGWVSMDALDVSGCPQVGIAQAQAATSQAALVATMTAISGDVATFTPTPAPANVEATTVLATPVPASDDTTAQLATPSPVTANEDQSADLPAVKCPTPASRVIMYARPSLDSYKFSQDYDAAGYQFTLLDSADADGQTWYYVEIDTSVSQKQGWIMGDDYNVIKECAPQNATAQTIAIPSDDTVPLVPTIIPPDVSSASIVVPTALAIPTMPIYTHYVVQPGDTLLYILARFNLDASALPKVAFINHLPATNPTLSEGMTLLIPTPSNNQPLICVVSDQQTVELRALPSAAAPVLLTLPAGAIFQIGDRTQQSDETWYVVTAQINETTISNVWVQSGAPLDCQRFAPDSTASALPVDPATGEIIKPTPTLVR